MVYFARYSMNMKCIIDNIIIVCECKNALFLCLSWSQHSFQIVIIVLCIFDTYLPPDVDTLTTVMFVLLNVCHSSRTRLGSPINKKTVLCKHSLPRWKFVQDLRFPLWNSIVEVFVQFVLDPYWLILYLILIHLASY